MDGIKIITTGTQRQRRKDSSASAQQHDFDTCARRAQIHSTLAQRQRAQLESRFSTQPKVVAPPRVRLKAYSHKVRTGCEACKRRHVKCGEERPACRRCKKAGYDCDYNLPKTWLFEHMPSNTPPESQDVVVKAQPSAVSKPPQSLMLHYGSVEENRALKYWIDFTAPWLANYARSHNRSTFEQTFPRCSYTHLGTRHILVAISLLDEQLAHPTPEKLVARSRRILYHYNEAIRQLTHNDPSMVEAISSSLLAWILETCLHSTDASIVHLDASSRLLDTVRQSGLKDDGTEAANIIFNELMPAQESCSGYLATVRKVPAPITQDIGSIYNILAARHGPQQMTSPEQARIMLEKYFDRFERVAKEQRNTVEARTWLHDWEFAVFKYRFVATAPAVNLIALHLVVNLAMTLLRAEVSSTDATDATIHKSQSLGPADDEKSEHDIFHEGISYVLNRAEELLSTQGMKPHDRRDLEASIELILRKVVRHSSERIYKDQAEQMLQTLNLEAG